MTLPRLSTRLRGDPEDGRGSSRRFLQPVCDGQRVHLPGTSLHRHVHMDTHTEAGVVLLQSWMCVWWGVHSPPPAGLCSSWLLCIQSVSSTHHLTVRVGGNLQPFAHELPPPGAEGLCVSEINARRRPLVAVRSASGLSRFTGTLDVCSCDLLHSFHGSRSV